MKSFLGSLPLFIAVCIIYFGCAGSGQQGGSKSEYIAAAKINKKQNKFTFAAPTLRGLKNPQNFYDSLGDVSKNNFKKIEYYKKAISEGAEYPSIIYAKIGDGYEKTKDYDNALNNYEQALGLGFTDDKLIIEVAYICKEKGEYKEAIKYYKEIKNWDNIHPGNKKSFATCYKNIKEYDKAIELYKELKEYNEVADCYYQLGNYYKAIDNYLLDISSYSSQFYIVPKAKNEHLGNSYYSLAECYAAINNKGKAFDAYKNFYNRKKAFEAYENAYNYMPINNARNLNLKYKMELYKILYANPYWDLINGTNERLYLYQKKGINENGKFIITWIKEVLFPYSKDLMTLRKELIKEYPDKTWKYNAITSTLSLYEFDCSSNKIRLLESVDCIEYGYMIDSFFNNDPKWEKISPESIAETWMKAVCKMN